MTYMYKNRKIAPELVKALNMFPVCVLTGARQTGKSTLLRHELPEYEYVTFDDPLQRDFATADPSGFLHSLRQNKGTILDEIQYVPDLLPYIKMDVDNNRTPGRWVLTGSQQFHLMKNISESLAGRVVLFDLAPFCAKEIAVPVKLDDLLWTGQYPEPTLNPEKRDLWTSSYIQTYLERDIRQLGNISDIHSFETVTKLCAARHGQELNIAALSRESGVATATIKRWVGLLESCYLIRLIQPFHNNLGKRVVKSPKIYFLDSGLAAYLTRQPSASALGSGNMAGPFFEGFIISEAIKCFFNNGRKPDIFFWRSHDGLEVDLLIQIADRVVPVEIKRTATPKLAFTQPLQRFKSLLPQTEGGLLVCQVEKPATLANGAQALPWQQFYPWLENLLSTS